MAQPLIGFLAFAVGIVIIAMAPVVAVWLIIQALKALGFAVGNVVRLLDAVTRHLLRFVTGVVVDCLRFAGSILTAIVVLPLALANLALLRFPAVRHYGAAVEDELVNAFACAYRVAIGHPIRLLGLDALTDGLERRLPELLEDEPMSGEVRREKRSSALSRLRPGGRSGTKGSALRRGAVPCFEGYDLIEELSPGGSGARIFSAAPTPARAAQWRTRLGPAPSKVVIKAFDLGYGSTIPQIVRESRSLEAAKRLGLVLDHSLQEDAFHYVMPFVPGVDLGTETRQLHATNHGDGLDADRLRTVLGYARDLCDQLTRFHAEGLWHKDIKPSNLMVDGKCLQVVDFGLVTPLESALTLTTHGTEFFRDPELVRLALAGRRVKDVDGIKFDVYSAGAVIYSMLENSFPAHGSLSSISKPAPAALRWIVRRAMTDIDKRYASAEELGRDLDVLIAANEPHDVKPADLPSVDGATPPPRPSIDEARRTYRVRRESPLEAQERASIVKIETRRGEIERRRKRGRGILKAVGVLAIFGGLTAGVLESRAYREARARPAVDHGSSVAPGPRLESTAAAPAPPIESVLHGAVLDDLARLRTGRRVLLVADPANPGVRREAERAAVLIRSLGLAPVGFTGDARSTVDPENVATLSDALIALEQRPSGQTARQCLREFLREASQLDAVLHLSTAAHGRGLRTTLELAAHVSPFQGQQEPTERQASPDGSEVGPSALSAWRGRTSH
ncbi:MAG: hypothetical protein VX015_03550 [Planctomycetota bacterium]|nr:hypothetical protein [Planctomycetota bacterium]